MVLLDFHWQLLPKQPSLGKWLSYNVIMSLHHISVNKASHCMQQFIHDFCDFLTDLSDEDFEDHVSKGLIM